MAFKQQEINHKIGWQAITKKSVIFFCWCGCSDGNQDVRSKVRSKTICLSFFHSPVQLQKSHPCSLVQADLMQRCRSSQIRLNRVGMRTARPRVVSDPSPRQIMPVFSGTIRVGPLWPVQTCERFIAVLVCDERQWHHAITILHMYVASLASQATQWDHFAQKIQEEMTS